MKLVSEQNGLVVLATGNHSLSGVWADETPPSPQEEYAIELDIAPVFTWGVDLHAAKNDACSVTYNGMANQFQGAVLSSLDDGVLGIDSGVALIMLEARHIPAGLEYVTFSVAPTDVRIYPVFLS